MLGDVECVYECDEYPGDRDPERGALGADSVAVREADAAFANGLCCGNMVRGDVSVDSRRDGCITGS